MFGCCFFSENFIDDMGQYILKLFITDISLLPESTTTTGANDEQQRQHYITEPVEVRLYTGDTRLVEAANVGDIIRLHRIRVCLFCNQISQLCTRTIYSVM
jgi:hypothetical protein